MLSAPAQARAHAASRSPAYRRICIYTSPYAYMQPLTSGVAACARHVGMWQIDIFFSTGDLQLAQLFDGRYEGVIIAYPLDPPPANFHQSRSRIVTATFAMPGVAGVVHDNVAIGFQAAQHLYECGYRSFAFFGVPTPWSDERLKGFEQFVRHKSAVLITKRAGDERYLPWDALMSEQWLDAFLREIPPRTAVLTACDEVGRRLVDLAVRRGLRVPGDLAVIGVDNDELRCETGTVPLTSIDTNIFRVGYEAGLMLDRLMRAGSAGPATVIVPPKGIVRRQSTSLAAHDDSEIAAAMRFIFERACDGIRVDDVCDHLAISRRRLEIRFNARSDGAPATRSARCGWSGPNRC